MRTRLWSRRFVTLPAILALAGGPLIAVGPAAHGAPRANRPGPSVRHSAAPAPLTASAALMRAHATGHPVTVTSMTTPTTTTTALPGGDFQVREYLQPVRAWRHGRWRALNPDLSVTKNGWVTPAVTTHPVALSDGGTRALAVVSNLGRTLRLRWPGRLPVPAISGPTATYRNVLPGVDLVLSVSGQGTVTDTLVVRDAAAAADHRLRSLRLIASAPGLRLSAAPGGGFAAKETSRGTAIFAAPAARMWDSARPPKGTLTRSLDGAVILARSGSPAYSTLTGPGAFAHVTSLRLKVSSGAITIAVPGRALSGRGVRYPLFIDPTWSATSPKEDTSAWTEILSGLSGSGPSYWDTSGQLQVGYCDPYAPGFYCGSPAIGVTRSMFRLPLPSITDHTKVTVDKADIYLTDQVAADCDSEPIQLWTTPAISSSSDWSSSHNWDAEQEQETFKGYGYSGCGWNKYDVTFGTDSTASGGTSKNKLASTIQSDLRNGYSNQTFGIRAADESTTDGTAWYQWRQFSSGKSAGIYLQFTYHLPPAQPTCVAVSPAPSCSTNSQNETNIGNDDVGVTFKASDPDGETGSYLTSTIQFYASDTGAAIPADEDGTINVSGSGQLSITPIPRATIQSWQANGSQVAYRYYFTLTTTNSWGQSATSPDYYFVYNPTGPTPPTVTGFPASVTLGQTVTNVSFQEPSNCGSNCPTEYIYQLGPNAPVTVPADSSGNWTGSITVPILGPFLFSVSSMASDGNPGQAYTESVDSYLPASGMAADGYLSNGKYPDVLTIGSGSNPSLWLYPGTANGTVGQGIDIGSNGDGLYPGSDGPGDWAGAIISHGNFLGHGMQDVMAYYPAKGSGMVVGGTGAPISLNDLSSYFSNPSWSDQAGSANIPSGLLCDTAIDSNCASDGTANPTDLVAAGNASQQDTGIADLIGIAGSGSTYNLDLYTAFSPAGYNVPTALSSGNGPDGNSWSNYSVATAQLPDASYPNGDPSDTILLALDNSNGELWESTNPNLSNPPNGQDCTTDPSQSVCSIIGSPTSTWTQITVPWGSAPPALISADVNSGTSGQGSGKVEIWTRSGSTAIAYQVSGTSLTEEGSGSTLAEPSNDWPLTDGSNYLNGYASNPPATAVDTVGGDTGNIVGTISWQPDPEFSTVLGFDGTSTYLAPPADTIPTSASTPTLSLWFETTSNTGGILASLQSAAVSSGASTVPNYDPVMYIGNNGHLYAEFLDGGTHPIESASQVDDGLWHHAVLETTGSGSSAAETLYIDGVAMSTTLTGTINLADATNGTNPTNLTFGDGYIGGMWPGEPNYGSIGGSGSPGYFFNGEIADITFTK